MAVKQRIQRIERDDLYKKWNSQTGFDELKGAARENGLALGQQMEAESPTDPKEHKYQAVEEVLYRRGYDLFDEHDGYVTSSPMKAFGSWTKENDVPNTEEANDRLLLDEHFSKSYSKTLVTGVKTKNLELVKSINSIGGVEEGTVFNPIYNDPTIIRAKLFGPAIDYRRIVGDIIRIREETYKLTKYDNDPDERKMDRMAEGTTPRMMELDYSEDTLRFELFRKGIEATYDYLNSEQTRVSMIRNAIEEVAEQHRIAIFEMIVTEIEKAHIGSGYTYDAMSGVDGKITLNQWNRFRKTFGAMYSPDIVLGQSDEISEFELMFFQLGVNRTDGNSIAPAVPAAEVQNSMVYTNPRSLNNVPMMPEYGWYDSINDVLASDHLLVFDRERSSRLVFQIGSDQDETQRHPGPRVIQRFLATKAGVEVPDAHGIRKFHIQGTV